ncbi:MAG: TolC family protein [Candidatus Marinimicrobia bacterium]|nr:TolC family protein [Candidatus Neomarinimicrobiota bacterium]MDD5581820.1 TolC family protein [Candidatus Neomarinimicrobiota bacterium]
MHVPVTFTLPSFLGGMLLTFSVAFATEHDTLELTLEKALEYAHDNSPEIELVRQNFFYAQETYDAFLKDYLPQVILTSNVPGLNRSIKSVQQPDGSIAYRAQSQTYGTAAIQVRQRVSLTGGTFTASSGIERFDNLNTNNYYWRSTPFVLSYQQPIFQPNTMKWNRELEKIQFELSKRAYEEQLNSLNIRIVNAFFNVYINQINLEITKINYTVNDTVFNLSKHRFDVGKIAENDLLQSELELMKAESSLEAAQYELNRSLRELLILIGMPVDAEVKVIAPTHAPTLEIDQDLFLERAMELSPDVLRNRLSTVNAELSLKQAQTNQRFNAELSMGFGYNQSGENLLDLYKDPFDQEHFTMSLEIPLFTGGKNKAQVNARKSALKAAEIQEALTRQKIQEEIIDMLRQFEQLKKQIDIAVQSDTIAQRRFEVTKNRYLIGKVDITSLFMAQQEQDLARRTYIQTLKNYWMSYYQILGILNSGNW